MELNTFYRDNFRHFIFYAKTENSYIGAMIYHSKENFKIDEWDEDVVYNLYIDKNYSVPDWVIKEIKKRLIDFILGG